MIKTYFHTFIFIIACILILSTCPGCDFQKEYMLFYTPDYSAEEQPGWCVPACIEMWQNYNWKWISDPDTTFATQQEIADYIDGLSGDLLQNTRDAVIHYTDHYAVIRHSNNNASGLNKCIEWMTACLKVQDPAIIPFDAGDYSVLLLAAKYEINERFLRNAEHIFEYITVHDPVHGAEQEHTRTSLETNFLPIDDEYTFVAGSDEAPWTFDGYLEFLKLCGTYYGGPEIYIPEGSIFLRVRYPQGYPTLAHGESDRIIWESNGMTGQIKLELYKNDLYKGTIASNLPIENGSYTWTVGDYQGGSVQTCDDYTIRVSRMDDSFDDFSNTNFAMGSVDISSPNGGEAWEEGTLKNITWNSSYFTGNVKILLRKTVGATDYLIAEDVENTGIYEWAVGTCTHTDGDNPTGSIGPGENCYKIKVISMNNDALMDSSNDTFSIIEPPSPGITVTAPNGSESIVQGVPYEITWESTGIVGNVKIELSKDNGVTWPVIVVESTENDGSYILTVPETGVQNDNCLIRISELDGDPADVSDAAFTLLPPSITVMQPNGGEIIESGTTLTIAWTSVGNIGNVKIEFSKNNGGAWQTITESTENTGLYNYQVPIPGEQKDNCLIRISDTADGYPVDVSDAVFTVTVPGS